MPNTHDRHGLSATREICHAPTRNGASAGLVFLHYKSFPLFEDFQPEAVIAENVILHNPVSRVFQSPNTGRKAHVIRNHDTGVERLKIHNQHRIVVKVGLWLQHQRRAFYAVQKYRTRINALQISFSMRNTICNADLPQEKDL